jgi:hypothetical protein
VLLPWNLNSSRSRSRSAVPPPLGSAALRGTGVSPVIKNTVTNSHLLVDLFADRRTHLRSRLSTFCLLHSAHGLFMGFSPSCGSRALLRLQPRLPATEKDPLIRFVPQHPLPSEKGGNSGQSARAREAISLSVGERGDRKAEGAHVLFVLGVRSHSLPFRPIKVASIWNAGACSRTPNQNDRA